LAFITAHFPAFVTELCGPILPGSALYSLGITTTSRLGALAISLIGLANIAGTLAAGFLGNRYSKKYLLAGIYLSRTIVAALFIALPITPISVIIFSVVMGSLWLATVPLTSGLIAHIYGLRYTALSFSRTSSAVSLGFGWAARCMTSIAPIRWFGGLGSEWACSAPSYTCPSKSAVYLSSLPNRPHRLYDEDKRI
jgi:MFS family permease